MGEGGLNGMQRDAIAVGILAAVVLTTTAVVQGFKDTGLVDTGVADNFIAGLAIFGSFVAVIVLAIVGKIVIGLFRTKD